MADAQLLDRVRGGDQAALVELAELPLGSRGFSQSREEAKQAAADALESARAKGEKKSEACALYALVRLRLQQGEFLNACQRDANQAVKLFQELSEKKLGGSVHLLLAKNGFNPGFDPKPDEAVRRAREALALFDTQADKAAALKTQAEALLAAQRAEEAAAAAGEAVKLSQGDATSEAFAELLLAKAQLLNKEFQKAEDTATGASKKLDKAFEVQANTIVAEALVAKGQACPIAESTLEDAKKLQKKDPLAEASLMHLLAKSTLRANEVQSAATKKKAIEWAEQAQTIYLLRGETRLEAEATHTAAKTHLVVKAYAQALQLSLQASVLASSLEDTPLEASALYTASQARVGLGRTGEALLAARKAAELFHAIGDKESERAVALAMDRIEDKMPPPHRPTNVLSLNNPAQAPSNVLSQASQCIVWNQPCKEGAYINYTLELLRLVDDISRTTMSSKVVVCSMGVHARQLGVPMPGQQKDVNSMAVWGVVRTVRLEMPRLNISTVDLPTDADGAEMARVICDATVDSGARHEVAYAKVAGDGQKLLEKLGRA